MTISFKTHKTLWGRAAGRCSHPDCRLDLFFDEDDADTPSLIGEMCHIVAENDGVRADPSMAIEIKNSYANLILLCRNHHKLIDDIENGARIYPIELLYQMKRDHEAWVRGQLGFDAQKQADDEDWTQIIEGWEKRCHVDTWRGWTSFALSGGQPMLYKDISNDLEDARRWLLTRVWPHRYDRLRDAFENFRRVLEAFCNKFHEQSELVVDTYYTRKFYKIDEWNEEKYDRLLNRFNWHVDLIQDLVLELTRAANLVCDRVREHVFRGYRRQQGRLSIESGPLEDLSFRQWIVQYVDDERHEKTPFHGLTAFITGRAERDESYGVGPMP